MGELFILDLKKAQPTETGDGVLTKLGMQVAHEYARDWVAGTRNLALERQYSELIGLFYDIRVDSELAREHSIPFDGARTESLVKSSGPYIGPRGGKWADPKHTIPWKEEKGPKGQQELFSTRRNWIAHHPDLPRQTVDKWKNRDGSYKRERKGVHDRIVGEFMADKKLPPADVKKVAIVMMGGPASGKTTIAKRVLGETFNDFVNVNPDDVKEMLPEYQTALEFDHQGKKTSARDAAWMSHEESIDIADEVYDRAVDGGYSLILDGTGKDAGYHVEEIQKLRNAGYHVQLLMPDLGVEEAVDRSEKRAERTGRYVPAGPPPPGTPAVIQNIYRVVGGNFERIARAADEFSLFDSRKFPPDLKWSGGKGIDDVVHDETFVRKFRGKHMGKAENDSQKLPGQKPHLTSAEIAERVKTAPAGLGREDEKKPKKFDKHAGVIQVLRDVRYGDREPIRYK